MSEEVAKKLVLKLHKTKEFLKGWSLDFLRSSSQWKMTFLEKIQTLDHKEEIKNLTSYERESRSSWKVELFDLYKSEEIY